MTQELEQEMEGPTVYVTFEETAGEYNPPGSTTDTLSIEAVKLCLMQEAVHVDSSNEGAMRDLDEQLELNVTKIVGHESWEQPPETSCVVVHWNGTPQGYRMVHTGPAS